jgi:hypothetical protein
VEQSERQYSNEPGFISLVPTAHNTGHHGALQKFADDLNKRLPALLQNRSASRYSAVNVLMLRWETETSLSVVEEMDELARVFSGLYSFTVNTFLIPSEKPQRKLSQRIMNLLEDEDDAETLQIIYYSGHSFLSNSGEIIWSRCVVHIHFSR